MITPARALCFLAVLCLNLRGDEFQNLSDGFGATRILVGIHQGTTSNPDGPAIDFWTSACEGGAANLVPLSNPHIAADDAFGNHHIADKASHAILNVTTNGLVHTIGHGYRVERSPNLQPGSWQPLGAVGGSAGNLTTQFLDPQPATGPLEFYRLLPSL